MGKNPPAARFCQAHRLATAGPTPSDGCKHLPPCIEAMNKRQTKRNFSLSHLRSVNPDLAGLFIWEENRLEVSPNEPVHLHLGCGNRVFDGFFNLDIFPQNPRVIRFNLLNPWPAALAGRVDSIFSEDLFEHFFVNEQIYLLCCANASLKSGGYFRILTPDLDQLIACFHQASPQTVANEYLGRFFGVATGADAINLGMRFGRHRWLHNFESLEKMGAGCGFDVRRTKLEEAGFELHRHQNLRTETDSLSFAADLIKQKPIFTSRIFPSHVTGAELIEKNDNIPMYRSKGPDPQIHYEMAGPVAKDRIVLLNFRSSLMSGFATHHNAKLYVLDSEEYALHLDSSLCSCFHANLFSASNLALKTGPKEISHLRFDPCESDNAYFTAGPLELFTF